MLTKSLSSNMSLILNIICTSTFSGFQYLMCRLFLISISYLGNLSEQNSEILLEEHFSFCLFVYLIQAPKNLEKVNEEMRLGSL